MSTEFTLSPELGKLAFGSILLMIECTYGGVTVMAERKKYFTPEFLSQFGN